MITRTLIHGKPAICVNVRAIVTFIQRKVNIPLQLKDTENGGRIVELLERHNLDQQNIKKYHLQETHVRLYSMYRVSG